MCLMLDTLQIDILPRAISHKRAQPLQRAAATSLAVISMAITSLLTILSMILVKLHHPAPAAAIFWARVTTLLLAISRLMIARRSPPCLPRQRQHRVTMARPVNLCHSSAGTIGEGAILRMMICC